MKDVRDNFTRRERLLLDRMSEERTPKDVPELEDLRKMCSRAEQLA